MTQYGDKELKVLIDDSIRVGEQACRGFFQGIAEVGRAAAETTGVRGGGICMLCQENVHS